MYNNMFDNIFNDITIENIKRDTMQFGLALVLSQIMAGKNLFQNNFANIKSIILTLLGFAIYQSVVTKIYITSNMNPLARITINDIIKFSVMLFFTRVLYNRENLFTFEFIFSVLNIIIGFVTYNTLISNNITIKMFSIDMKFNEIMAVNDIIKFSYVLILAGLLNQISGVGQFDNEYKKLTIGYVSGLALYDLFLS